MEFVSLLGKQLKDDEVIDILERWEAEVIYDFDRLHEGQPDVYWAASKRDGVQLRFDAAQRLDTVFIYIMANDGFDAFSQRDADVPFFETKSEAESFGMARRLEVAKGHADLLGVRRDWVRLNFGAYSVHYEFRGDSLAQVTISRSEKESA